MPDAQTELPLFKVAKDDPNVDWLIDLLKGRDWTKADHILRCAGKPVNENKKRWVRALADASEGRIAGGWRGYRLVTEMNHEQYNEWRNTWLNASNAIRESVIKCDRIFYGRQPIPT